MIAGHVGLALFGASARPRVPLALLLVAALGPDLVRIAFDASGIGDASELRSHALLPAVLGAVAAAVLVRVATRQGEAALLVALLWLSHLPADWITGRKPTWPGGPAIGAGLYARPAWDLVIEATLLLAGWVAWRRRTSGERVTVHVALATILLYQLLFAMRRLDLL